MSRPYESAFVYDAYAEPVLAFLADLPAFQVLGRKLYAVEAAYEEYCEERPWRQLVDAQLANATDQKDTRGNSRPEIGNPWVGRFRIECGDLPEPTDAQKELFDALERDQHTLADQLKEGARRIFDETVRWRASDDPQERILFPKDATDEEKLDRFVVRHIKLDPNGRFFTIELESLDCHHLEHGCSVVIRDGHLLCAGDWDTVLQTLEMEGLEEPDEPDA